MAQERRFRITGRNDQWCVQYGYDSRRGSTSRFAVLREWPAEDLQAAHRIVAREKVNVLFDPPAVAAMPLPETPHIRRAVRSAPADISGTVKRALDGLSDPLPDIAESHAKLGTAEPARYKGGRQFYTHMAEPVYQRLAAMAAAAGVTRNRMIEVLVLSEGADG